MWHMRRGFVDHRKDPACKDLGQICKCPICYCWCNNPHAGCELLLICFFCRCLGSLILFFWAQSESCIRTFHVTIKLLLGFCHLWASIIALIFVSFIVIVNLLSRDWCRLAMLVKMWNLFYTSSLQYEPGSNVPLHSVLHVLHNDHLWLWWQE